MAHPGDSHEQRVAESLILARVSKRIGLKLEPRSLRLEEGARVDVDGVASDESVLVEIFAHHGALKGGQRHKVAGDALKLATLARTRPESRLIIAFGDATAAAGVTGKNWLSEALSAWKIEVVIVDLEEEVHARLRAAQVQQSR